MNFNIFLDRRNRGRLFPISRNGTIKSIEIKMEERKYVTSKEIAYRGNR